MDGTAVLCTFNDDPDPELGHPPHSLRKTLPTDIARHKKRQGEEKHNSARYNLYIQSNTDKTMIRQKPYLMMYYHSFFFMSLLPFVPTRES